jgi:hypothetical protein
MRNSTAALVLASLAVLAFFALRRPLSVHSQVLAPALEGQQFRIAVGLTDTEEKDWHGKVNVTGGEIVSVEGWRSNPQESASADGTFQFRTKIGLLENQLRPDGYFGQTGLDGQAYRHLIPQGLMVKLRGSPASVQFQSTSGTFSFRPNEIPYGTRAAFLDGNASVERFPIERKLSASDENSDYPAIAVDPAGKIWTAWISYRDKSDGVIVSDGTRVFPVGDRGDLHAPAIVSSSDGVMYVVWPRNEGGGFKLYSSAYRNGTWSKPVVLAAGGSSNFWPQLAADPKGHVALVWQSFREGQSVILLRVWNGKRWSDEQRVNDGSGNCWAPAVSYGGERLWVAWDSYQTGAYQIYAREWKPSGGAPPTRVTSGDSFSVRPSIVVTASGQPIVGWEESDPLWGKDFAYQVDRRGTTEYRNRRVHVAALESGSWKEVGGQVVEAVPPEIRRFVQQPQLAMDSAGHLYMSLRIRTSTRNSRQDYFAGNGRWESFVTHLDGNRWAPLVTLPSSVGRNSMRAAITIDRDQVHAAWATDGRLWTSGAYRELAIYEAMLPLSRTTAQLSGGVPLSVAPSAANPNPNEADDVRRVRAYRYNVNGKILRILRGDFHRHTELSGDGAGDGMLEDNYRYTLDAASMDIGYVSDHQMGQNEEYNWWMTQKSNDLYYMPQRFVPMYGYERSVPFPNGHRNIIWSERGKPVLRISPEEMQGKQNTGPILYPYLRETGGIATSHTSATQQGTDWRDNDPELEPVVEIYQGYDANYEEPGAPRAWKPGHTTSHEANKPEGYVWNAWAKGYKLGVQSSSDHISTHTSYACILAEEFTRKGIMDAIRKRHTYAATDNIVMDFRIANAAQGVALMGDIVDAATPPKLLVHVIGTASVKTVDLVKNNKYIHQLSPNRNDVQFEYLDLGIEAGSSYYYVRIEQADGQLAWSSPIWVNYRPK